MASPQVENGHIKIASEIYDALCRIRIPGEARQILDCIIRKTYGWNKKCDAISLTQFCETTGINRPGVVRAIKKLIKMNLVSIEKDTRVVSEKILHFTSTYRFNKDYETWIGSIKKDTSSIIFAEKVVSKKIHTKDTIQKTKELSSSNISKNQPEQSNPEPKPVKTFLSNSDEIRLSEYLFNHILKNNPNAKKPNLQSWAKDFDLMIRVDKRPVANIKAVIAFCQKDSFWLLNILSAKTLRAKYDQLTLKMNNVKPAAENKCQLPEFRSDDDSFFANPGGTHVI